MQLQFNRKVTLNHFDHAFKPANYSTCTLCLNHPPTTTQKASAQMVRVTNLTNKWAFVESNVLFSHRPQWLSKEGASPSHPLTLPAPSLKQLWQQSAEKEQQLQCKSNSWGGDVASFLLEKKQCSSVCSTHAYGKRGDIFPSSSKFLAAAPTLLELGRCGNGEGEGGGTQYCSDTVKPLHVLTKMIFKGTCMNPRIASSFEVLLNLRNLSLKSKKKNRLRQHKALSLCIYSFEFWHLWIKAAGKEFVL